MQFLLSLKKFLVIICKSHHIFKYFSAILKFVCKLSDQIVHILLCILSVGIYLNLFSSPLIYMILNQHSFFLLYRFECRIVQFIPIVDNAWAQKTLTVAGAPWRTSARFGVTVKLQHRIPCIGSRTNQDDAPQSLQCSPMNCSEPLPGIIYPLFALITQYIY